MLAGGRFWPGTGSTRRKEKAVEVWSDAAALHRPDYFYTSHGWEEKRRYDMVGGPARVMAPFLVVVGKFGKRDSKSRFCKSDDDPGRGCRSRRDPGGMERNERRARWPGRSQADDVVQSAQAQALYVAS